MMIRWSFNYLFTVFSLLGAGPSAINVASYSLLVDSPICNWRPERLKIELRLYVGSNTK